MTLSLFAELLGHYPPSVRGRVRPSTVAQIVNLPCRRLVVGGASVQPDASPPAHTSRISNPRYGSLPACATPAEATVAGMTAQTSSERGASLRAKGRRPTGGAMLRAPAVRGRARPSTVAQIVNLPCRRLVVGGASVQPSAFPPARASRITNPRYGRLPACATAAQATVAGMTAQTSSERGASLRAKVRRPTGGAMLRAPAVKQCSALRTLEAGRVRAP
jgi:hypothetical protein